MAGLTQDIRELAQQFKDMLAPLKQAAQLRVAKVVSVQTGPPVTLTLSIDGVNSFDNITPLASYTSPAANDLIWVLVTAGNVIALGPPHA